MSPPYGCELQAHARVGVRACAELVERRKRSAEHGRRGGAAKLDVRTDLVQLGLDLLDRALAERARDAAAERDLHVPLRQVEPLERCAHERDDLERQALDDR